MAKRHGALSNRCPRCLKPFATRRALDDHLKATGHRQFVGDAESERQRKALQHYHQDKVAG